MKAESLQLPRQIIALSTGEITSRALGFAGMVLIARSFDAGVLGIISFGFTLLTLSSVVGSFGLDILGIRSIASDPTRMEEHASGIISTKILLALPALLVFFAYIVFFSRGDSHSTLVIALFALPLLLNPFSLDFVFTATERNAVTGIRTTIQAAVYFFGVFVVTRYVRVLPLLPAFIALSMIAGLAYTWILSPIRVRISLVGGVRKAMETIRSAAFIGGSHIIVAAYLQLNILILGLLLNFHQVGLYTAAQRITAAIAFFPAIVIQIFMARISVSESAASKVSVTAGSLLPLSIAGSVVCGNLILLAPDIVLMLYGSEYHASVEVLQVLLTGTWITFFSMCFANPLPLWGLERKYFTIVLAGVIVNVVSCILLVDAYGISGAAASMLFTELLVLVLALRVFLSVTKGAPRGRLLLAALPLVLPITAVLIPLLLTQNNLLYTLPAYNIGIITAAMIIYNHRDSQHGQRPFTNRHPKE